VTLRPLHRINGATLAVLLAGIITFVACAADAPEGDALALEMRPVCEKCEASLTVDGDATICSYECTFCPTCATAMEHVCPNCGGDLVPRPKRQ